MASANSRFSISICVAKGSATGSLDDMCLPRCGSRLGPLARPESSTRTVCWSDESMLRRPKPRTMRSPGAPPLAGVSIVLWTKRMSPRKFLVPPAQSDAGVWPPTQQIPRRRMNRNTHRPNSGVTQRARLLTKFAVRLRNRIWPTAEPYPFQVPRRCRQAPGSRSARRRSLVSKHLGGLNSSIGSS